MKTRSLSTAGINPSITIDANGLHIVWQNGSFIYRADVSTITLEGTTFPVRALTGGAASYPEIWGSYMAWRDGNEPYHGHLNEEDLGQVHGSRPFVFGEGKFAYISGGTNEGYPVKMKTLPGGSYSVVRNAAGTGLSRLTNGQVVTIDEAWNAVPGIVDPSWAGDAVVGATDKNGKPTLLAFRGDKQCYIATGQVSKDPRMVTDGNAFFVVAWGDQGEGVRLWRIEPSDFVVPVKEGYDRTPDELPLMGTKYVGHYYSHGRDGEYWPEENCTVIGKGLYEDGAGNLPPDALSKMKAAALDTPRIIVTADRTSIDVVRGVWDRVAMLMLGELDGPEQVRNEAQKARDLVKSLGLASRPVMSTIGIDVGPEYIGTADYHGVKVYFDKPAADFRTMEQQVATAITQVVGRLGGKIMLIPQAYDRNSVDWKANPAMVEAILYTCGVKMAAVSNIVGCAFFAYGRKNGVVAYPQWEPWTAGICEKANVPSKLPVNQPEEGMTADDLRRYVAELENNVLFGAYQRFHNEVLERDRPKDGVIKAADGSDMWTGDVTTGGANAIFNRVYIVEYCIARDQKRTMEQASGDGYDKGMASYDKAVGRHPQ